MTGNDSVFFGYTCPQYISPTRAKTHMEYCEWKDEVDCWRGSCGIEWCFNNDDGPRGNKMNYCPKCGRLLKEDR